MSQSTGVATYLVALLVLAFWVRYVMADESSDVLSAIDSEEEFAEDGICTFGNQETMCHKVLLSGYPDFVYYVVYNKRMAGEEYVWVPIVIKKCSLDLSLQTNIWQNIDGEKPDVPVRRRVREWNA